MKPALTGTVFILAVLSIGPIPVAEGRGRRPPAAAYEACEGLSEGDRCSVNTPRGTMEGTCKVLSEGDELACFPDAFDKSLGATPHQ